MKLVDYFKIIIIRINHIFFNNLFFYIKNEGAKSEQGGTNCRTRPDPQIFL